MNIPNFQNVKVVNSDGFMHHDFQQLMSLMTIALQSIASSEGLITPAQPAEKIAQLTNSQSGTLLYDGTNKKLLANIDGDFKIIQTS